MTEPAETAGRPLSGKCALVTGGSRNLGALIAISLARRGADVAIGYLEDDARARQVVDSIESEGVAGLALRADLSDSAQLRRLVQQAIEALGRAVDILINNAGPFAGEPFASLEESEWDRIMAINLKAAYLAAQVCVPGMKRAGWGRIVNISAGSAFVRNHSVYGLAKQALITLTEAMALELGPEITVNAVAPGQIAESAPDISEIDPTFVERAITQSPAGRLVTRVEVAEVVAWLCGPSADLITGQTIALDGGWRLPRF